MKVERIDHIHIKTNDLKNTTSTYEGIFGEKFPPQIDFTQIYGMKVAFNPFPNGIELMEVTDKQKEMGSIYDTAPEGVFALSLKVQNLDEATVEMEAMGYKQILRYEFGQIKEALFDTKKACGVLFELVEYLTENIADADYGDLGLDR